MRKWLIQQKLVTGEKIVLTRLDLVELDSNTRWGWNRWRHHLRLTVVPTGCTNDRQSMRTSTLGQMATRHSSMRTKKSCDCRHVKRRTPRSRCVRMWGMRMRTCTRRTSRMVPRTPAETVLRKVERRRCYNMTKTRLSVVLKWLLISNVDEVPWTNEILLFYGITVSVEFRYFGIRTNIRSWYRNIWKQNNISTKISVYNEMPDNTSVRDRLNRFRTRNVDAT